jgi:hypothetical protein
MILIAVCVPLVIVKAGKEPLTVLHLKRIIELAVNKPEDDAPQKIKSMFSRFEQDEDFNNIFGDYNTCMETIQADKNLRTEAKDWLREFLPLAYVRLVARLLKGASTSGALYSKVSS